MYDAIRSPFFKARNAEALRRVVAEVYDTHVALQPMLMRDVCLYAQPEQVRALRAEAERFIDVVSLGPPALELPLEQDLLLSIYEMARNPMAKVILHRGRELMDALLPRERRGRSPQRVPLLQHWLDAIERREAPVATDTALLYLAHCREETLELINRKAANEESLSAQSLTKDKK